MQYNTVVISYAKTLRKRQGLSLSRRPLLKTYGKNVIKYKLKMPFEAKPFREQAKNSTCTVMGLILPGQD